MTTREITERDGAPCGQCGTRTRKYDALAGPYCGCKNDRPNGFFCHERYAERCKAAGRCVKQDDNGYACNH